MRYLNKCPICASTHIGHYYKHRDSAHKIWTIYRCKCCTHGFINPQPSRDELSGYYSETYEPYKTSDSLLCSDDETIEEAIKTGKFRHIQIRPGMRILDIGCGGGYFLKIVSKLGAITEGIEVNKIGAMRAQELGLKVFNGTVEEYVKENRNKFDVVTLNHVLEHIHDPVNTLTAMNGLLTDKGFVYIAVPNANYWASRALKGRWHSTEIPRHLHQFTADSIIKAADISGWRNKKLATYSLPKATASSMRLWLRRYFLLPERIAKNVRLIDYFAPIVSNWLDSKNIGSALLLFLYPN